MPILSVKEAAEMTLPSPISKEYWENSEWAYEHMNEISAKYPNQWVIVFDKKVIAASRSGSEAEHIAKEKVANQEFVILFAEKGIRVY
jgi:hypothetical protein